MSPMKFSLTEMLSSPLHDNEKEQETISHHERNAYKDDTHMLLPTEDESCQQPAFEV